MYLYEALLKHRPGIQLCVSLSGKPGRTGTALHNAGYRALDLPFEYVACETNDLGWDLEQVRKAGVRGVSVSMPFKTRAAALVDALSYDAKHAGAINTIVNTGGVLTGHNTDVVAARHLLSGIKPTDHVAILGNGGVAKAFASVLFVMSINYRTFSRSPGSDSAWDDRHHSPKTTVLINATPLGMADEMPVDLSHFPNLRLVIDAVVGDTPLVQGARETVEVRTGIEMAFHQAVAQFSLYTTREAPKDAMEIALRELYPIY